MTSIGSNPTRQEGKEAMAGDKSTTGKPDRDRIDIEPTNSTNIKWRRIAVS